MALLKLNLRANGNLNKTQGNYYYPKKKQNYKRKFTQDILKWVNCEHFDSQCK